MSPNTRRSSYSGSSSDDEDPGRSLSSHSRTSGARARISFLLKRTTNAESVGLDWDGVGVIEALRLSTITEANLHALIDKLIECEMRFIENIDLDRILPSFRSRRKSTGPGVDLTSILHRIFKKHQ